jgi:hypothetical protein
MNASTGSFGVIYVAFGAPYLAMALTSLASLKVSNPAVPACIVTNMCESPPNVPWLKTGHDLHWVFVEESTSQNRDIKTRVYGYSPFEKTLYLDCDTLVLADISQLSFFLDHFDLLLRHIDRPAAPPDAKKLLFDRSVRFNEIIHFNGGVIGFRKALSVEQFFDCWSARYKSLGYRRDQPSLVEALYYSDVRLLPLPSKWNMGEDSSYISKRARDDVAIWHYKVRMDHHLESCFLRAVKWFSDDPKDLSDVKAWIKRRRKSRGYGRSPRWLVGALITGIRGPLSGVPQKRVGEETWKKLLED